MAGQKKRIALALGSGSARGMAHIGIIQRLTERGVEPNIVCGTSAGALVAAVYACGHLNDFASWVTSLKPSEVYRYLDIRLLSAGGGVAHASRLMAFLESSYGNRNIEDLPKDFTAVATDLYRAREVWLREGPLWDAVRASISIPGVLVPKQYNGRWLVDGALVNPVPVSVGRAQGAETIIAVNLNNDLIGKVATRAPHDPPELEIPEENEHDNHSAFNRLSSSIRGAANNLWGPNDKAQAPGALNVMLTSINVMQDRITRSRLAGEPADITLSPRLADIGLMEFNRADEAIREGRDTVDRMWPEISRALALDEDTSMYTPLATTKEYKIDSSRYVSSSMKKTGFNHSEDSL